MPAKHSSPYLTLHEAATYLRLTARTLDNMRQRGTGPVYTKHGARILYHRDDLLAWSQRGRRRTTTEKILEPPGAADTPAPRRASA